MSTYDRFQGKLLSLIIALLVGLLVGEGFLMWSILRIDAKLDSKLRIVVGNQAVNNKNLSKIFKQNWILIKAAPEAEIRVAQREVEMEEAANRFSLRGSSPCIDAAADVGLRVDFRGTKVPQGKGPDIGAVEYKIEPPQDLEIVVDNKAPLTLAKGK